MPDSLGQLLELMRLQGAVRLYAKKLAPNDNSKNQIYLGGDFSALNVIPYHDIQTDDTSMAGSKRDRAKARIRFFWVDNEGRYPAPDAQLILYPRYPEVRMSGFLKGCSRAPSDVMAVRDPGRVLFLGMTVDGDVLGFASHMDSSIVRELESAEWPVQGVFIQLPLNLNEKRSTREILLGRLAEIAGKGWIASQKLGSDGIIRPYRARNGGGYTLEAELGISPNGYSEPDFMGWEIKQFGVTDFAGYRPASPVTLMTPEPTGGIYKNEGVAVFLQRFGYADKSGKQDRRNFGGIYTNGKDFHADTGLKLVLDGYDTASEKLTDMDGGIVLLSRSDERAAVWSFKGLMQHWNRKHAQAAYVPSMALKEPASYAYGRKIFVCEQTDFID